METSWHKSLEMEVHEGEIREHEEYRNENGWLMEERFYLTDPPGSDRGMERRLWSHKTYTYQPECLTIEIRDLFGPFSGSPARTILSYDTLRCLYCYSEWDSEEDADFQCWYNDEDYVFEEIYYNGGECIHDRRLLLYGESGQVLEELYYVSGYYSVDARGYQRFVYEWDAEGFLLSTTEFTCHIFHRCERYPVPQREHGIDCMTNGGPWWAREIIEQWRLEKKRPIQGT